MPTYPVKYYTSTMPGAPVLTNNWGDLTNLLDAVLVDGFALKTIDTLTSAAGVATATISAGHGYQKDQVVLIAGCDQAEYNGEQRVLSATSTAFTFAVSGNPATPATGATKTAKVAPLGWERTFTGTNKRVFRSLNPQSNRPYLRVDNSLDPVWTSTYAKYGKITMAEAMTDIDTFVAGAGRAPFDQTAPTKNEVGTGAGTNAINGWHKWYYARSEQSRPDSTTPATMNRNWVLVGDDRGFFFFPQHDGFYGAVDRAFYAFTDFASFRQGDGYNTLLIASDAYMTASATPNANAMQWSGGIGAAVGAAPFISNVALGQVLMRDQTQLGGTVRTRFVTLGTNGGVGTNGQSLLATISGVSTGVPWPNSPDYSLVLHPIYLQQETGDLRGKLPGLMFVHNNGTSLVDGTVVSNVAGYPGRSFLIVGAAAQAAYSSVYASAYVAFDITGPWQ